MIMDIPVRHNFTIAGALRKLFPSPTLVPVPVEQKTVGDEDMLAFSRVTMEFEEPKFRGLAPLVTEKGGVMGTAAETPKHYTVKINDDASGDNVNSSSDVLSPTAALIAKVATKQEEPVEEAKDRRQSLQRTGMNKQQHQNRLSIMWGASNLGNKGPIRSTSKLSVQDSSQASEKPDSGDAAASHEGPTHCPAAELHGESIGTSPLPEEPVANPRHLQLLNPRDAVIPLESEVERSLFPTTAEIILRGSMVVFWVLIGHFMLYRVSLAAVY